MTRAEVEGLRHGETVHHNYLKNADETCQRWRVSGRLQTWKTRPDEFRLPIKHGLKDCGAITHKNITNFHKVETCGKAEPSSWLEERVQ